MLLWLAQFFQQDVGPLRVFSFISFRAVFATLTALAITVSRASRYPFADKTESRTGCPY